MDKFNDTINELRAHIEELENDFSAKVNEMNPEAREKAETIVNKTKTAILNSIDKLNSVITNIQDSEKLDEFLDKVKAKSKEAIEYAKTKIDNIGSNTDDKTLESLHDDVMAEFDKLRENETFKKTADLVKDVEAKINEFFSRPDVQETIVKMKNTTVKVAEKGVEGLKKVLDVDDEQNNLQ